MKDVVAVPRSWESLIFQLTLERLAPLYLSEAKGQSALTSEYLFLAQFLRACKSGAFLRIPESK